MRNNYFVITVFVFLGVLFVPFGYAQAAVISENTSGGFDHTPNQFGAAGTNLSEFPLGTGLVGSVDTMYFKTKRVGSSAKTIGVQILCFADATYTTAIENCSYNYISGGLYADASWRPLWRNEFITWPDYGIPTSELMGLTQIFEAYYKAKNGEMVEIGCIGGHGRTGTILAIMYIASAEGKVNGKEAYKFVKKTYCEHAIESEIQEWYIDYAAAYWYGHEMPEKPVVKAGGNDWCQITDHYAMMLRGHQKCADKGSECKYWNQDWNTYNKSEAEKKANDYTNFYTALPKTKDYDYVFGGIVRYHDDANTRHINAPWLR